MLASTFRLRKQDVERVYKKGRSFREDFLVARFLGNNLEHCRFAVVIPKKAAPKATQRTRLKRKTFTLLGEIMKVQKIGNFDIILSYKQLPKENDINPLLVRILVRVK